MITVIYLANLNNQCTFLLDENSCSKFSMLGIKVLCRVLYSV